MDTDWKSLSRSPLNSINPNITFSIQLRCKPPQASCYFWWLHHVSTGEPLCNNMIALNDSKLTFSIGYDFVKNDLDEFINYNFEYARDFNWRLTANTSFFLYGVLLLFSDLKWRQSHEFTRTVNYLWFWNMQFACAFLLLLFNDCCKQ